MNKYSVDFVQVVAVISAKAAKTGLSVDDSVAFAWCSVGWTGDASVDDNDFDIHMAHFKAITKVEAAR